MTPTADRRFFTTGGYAATVVALALLVACGDGNGTDGAPDQADANDDATEQTSDGEVPALVSGSDVVASVPVKITRHPDEEVVGTWYLLGEAGDANPTVLVELIDEATYDEDTTHELDDGRPVQVTTSDEPRRAITVITPAPRGGSLMAQTFDLDLTVDDLLAIATAFDPDQVDEPVHGLDVIGAVPIPAYLDGYTSTYLVEGEFVVWIDVDRLEGDEMLMYGFGPVEPDEIGGVPAWRLDRTAGTLPGFVFTLDDAYLVRLEGNLGMSDDELRDIAEQIRPATPEELRKGLEQGRSASTDDP